MPLRFLPTLLLVALLASPQTLAASPEATALWKLATALVEQGDGRAALERLRAAIQAAPEEVSYHRLYQDLMQENGQAREVIAEYKARVDREPDEPDWHYLYGRSTGDTKVARKEFDRALQLDPRHAWSIQGLGGVETAEGHLERAIERFQQSLEVRPNDAEVYNKLANVWLARREPTKAKESWKKAQALAPEDPHAWSNMGAFLSIEGDLAGAAELLQTAVQRAPGSPLAHTNLGFVLFKLQRFEESLAHFHAAVAIRPKDKDVAGAMLFVQQVKEGKIPFAAFAPYEKAIQAQQEDPKKAIQHYKEVLALAPGFTAARMNLGLLQASTGQLDEAEKQLKQVTVETPQDVDGWSNLGALYLGQKRPKEARPALERARSLAPEEPDTIAAVALVDLAEGRVETAIAGLKSAVSKAPNDPGLQFQLAGAESQLPNLPNAERALRKALELAPEFVDARVQLIAVLKAEAKFDPALQELSALERLAPGHADLAALRAGLQGAKQTQQAMALPGRIHMLQILVKDAVELQAVQKALAGGTSFEAVASRFGVGPERLRSGDVGWVDPKDLRPELASAVGALAPGGVSAAIDLGGTWVFLKRAK